MKTIAYIGIVLAALSFSSSKRLKHLFEDKVVRCSYETSQGRIDGEYRSYYKSGQKKSEGKFENNYRIGKWTVWDSTGRLRMQRVYSDPFTFKRLIPEIPAEAPIELLNNVRYTLKKNQEGYIDYFYLEERMIVWEKRIWRKIPEKDNALLFKENQLFNVIHRNVISEHVGAFDTKDDDFRNRLSPTIDTSGIKIVGFKIMEDCFFDNERLVTESRIIGICPIAKNRINKDTIDLFWVYFPQLRKFLAKELVTEIGVPEKVKTLDDLFFYRYFYGQICKESNVYDRAIASYKSGKEIGKEAERIEINLIESEHDIWMQFTK